MPPIVRPPAPGTDARTMTDAEFRAARIAVRQHEAAEPIRRADAAAAARLEADRAHRIATGQDEAGVRAALVARGMPEAEAADLAREISTEALRRHRGNRV